jgi:phospholipid/cholesterol/gamma-HCH transport system substrate-binding protein
VNRGNAVRLIALAVVVVVGFGYILLGVMGWRIGAQRYPITVILPRAGGVYPEADVTYRGVAVGKVVGLRLTPNNVAVQLSIDPGVQIPADSTASVKDLSAIGEQYLDLVPRSQRGRVALAAGPWLRPGAVIPESRTAVPMSVSSVLIDVSRLLASVNTNDIHALNQALSNGLGGTGQQFRTLIAQSENLVAALRASEPETVQLEVGGHSVLTTALATNNDFAQFSIALARLSGQLRASDADIVALLGNAVAAETQLGQLLTADSSSIEGLLSNSAVSFNTAAALNPAVQALFQALPVFAGNLAGISSGGQIRSELTYNAANTVCPYLPAGQIPLPTQATGPPNLSLSCPTSAPDLLQRGAPRPPAAADG